MADRYNDELKQMICRLYNEGKGKSLQDLAKEYGIPESTVRYWVVDKPRKNKKALEKKSSPEFEEMKKEIERLKEENDILKKAMTIFVKH